MSLPKISDTFEETNIDKWSCSLRVNSIFVHQLPVLKWPPRFLELWPQVVSSIWKIKGTWSNGFFKRWLFDLSSHLDTISQTTLWSCPWFLRRFSFEASDRLTSSWSLGNIKRRLGNDEEATHMQTLQKFSMITLSSKFNQFQFAMMTIQTVKSESCFISRSRDGSGEGSDPRIITINVFSRALVNPTCDLISGRTTSFLTMTT